MEQILKNEERVIFSLRKLYSQYGYQPFKMSRFEEYDLYVRNKDFLLSDQIITFSDRSGKLLALKPDVTLSIIKNAQDISGSVQKYYYNENVYRVDKGTQCFKEIMQTGLECVGDLSIYETAEVVLLAVQSLAVIGCPFVLDVSHMGFLNTVLDESGLSKESRKKAMNLLHQKNVHEMRLLCKSADCSENVTELLCTLTKLSGSCNQTLSLLDNLIFTERQTVLLDELRSICTVLAEQGFGANINIDFSAGSQMKYYSGVVFCGYLQGIPNAVLSGGQYDTLMQKMKKRSRAIGFAIYLDLLQRIQHKTYAVDVDTVLLYDDGSDISTVMDIAKSLRRDGSVQVVSAVPTDITYKRVMKIKDGEAILIESDS